jgi:penicillin-binding protein 2
LNLGKKTGVPLSGESPGILPGPEWLKLVSPTERWSDGYTANVAIGQGSVEASPLQMAMVTATIANRGISYEPRLIHRVLDQEGNDVRDETRQLVAPHEPKIRADLHDVGIGDAQIELIRRGMWKVVNEPGGTGKRAQVKGVEVAGKTGTAQFWRETDGKRIKDNHTWFISFAPYEKPKFAICVFVQGAKSGGGVSAPIAQKILEESLALEKGYDPGLQRLDPGVGSFAQIEQVDYKQTEVTAGNDAGPGDCRSHRGAACSQKEGKAGAGTSRYPCGSGSRRTCASTRAAGRKTAPGTETRLFPTLL